MGLITNMRSRMQVVMWTILVLFVTSMAIGGLVGGASITDIFSGRQGNEVGSLNGKPILFEDFNQLVSNEINRMDQQSGRLISDEEREYIRAVVWERLIADLIIQEQIVENKIVVGDEEVLFQMKNNPPPFLQNSDAFQSFGRFDLEKYLDAVLNPGQIDWKPIEDFMQNVYLPSYKLQQYITNSAAISSIDVLEDYKKRFLDYKIEVLHVTEKAIDQDFYNGLLAGRPSDDELNKIYNENISEYDQPELRYLKYVRWPIISNATDSLRVKLEAEDLIFRLNDGEDFALLANTYTQDPSNSADPQNLKGGDLGWFNKGQLLPEFEIASFEAEIGSIVGPILTQYGYHVIKVNDKRIVESNEQVNASHILLTIQPGRGTENELKDIASIFALEATEFGFFALADSLGLEIQESNGLRKESIFVDNFGVGRSAVNFAFNNVEGSTSDAIKNDNFYGVFFLDKVDKETVISFENVKEDLKNEFLSEFKKNHIKTLAQSIKDNNQGEMNLSEIYQDNENLEYVAETNSALIGSFESIGKSNFIVGALADAKEGDILGPLPTLRGQAFLRVIDISDVVMSDFEEKKDSIKFSLLIDRQNAIWGNWLQALRENADLKDYRYDFY
ncbi:SurA N-terminal domain-containing protein [Candidatus Marinimicrobia bacterium]|nr:SurA N-terminal domain-containing protein [Candidatus Neomarinimicrobiota bacterium]